jgi:dimethylamine monooxygenase subunit B
LQRATALIASVRQVAPDVKAFQLVPEDKNAIPFEPGGHLDVEVLVGTQVQTRSYSMFRLDDEPGFMIAVRRAPDGRGGSAYMWAQQTGSRLVIRRARNTMPITYNAERYVLIAGGIGVTPIIAAARALRSAGKSVVLHYCVRDASNAPFLSELKLLLGGVPVVHQTRGGRRPQPDALIAELGTDHVCYVCGPLGLMESIVQAWHRRGLPRQNLRFETFASSGRLPARGFEVLVRETGRRVIVSETASILDALIAAKQDVMYDCRRGECGLCKVDVDELDGEIDHRDVFLGDVERTLNKSICTCVSRVYGNSIAIRIDGISHGRTPR